ncbi:MAG: YidC/Oxa1 family insertase periplasmic-domain containing protein [Phycisphaerae bacterium]|nr:YidC/Oxa1 family insertase periplasmic-domain containing protein [Phycisphaerae bacterium]
MSPAARKFVITLLAVSAALGVLLVVMTNRPIVAKPPTANTAPTPTLADPNPDAGFDVTTAESGASAEGANGAAAPPVDSAAPPPVTTALVARAPNGPVPDAQLPAAIGSLDPRIHPFRIEFSATSAGIETILFADFWKSAIHRNAARAHARDPSNPMPPDEDRYVLATQQVLHEAARTFSVPVLAAHSVQINGASVVLFGNVWSEVAPGHFITEIVDTAGAPQFRIERRYDVTPGSYEFTLRQGVTNLTTAPATVRWVQYGPTDLPSHDSGYIDVRRFHFGYLTPPDRDPSQAFVLATGQMFEQATVLKQANAADENYRARIAAGLQPDPNDYLLWRNPDAQSRQLAMSWFGTTSRYFSLTIHPPGAGPIAPGSKAIGSTVEKVMVLSNRAPLVEHQTLLTELHSGLRTVEPGTTTEFDLGVFAGPLDPKLLGQTEPYVSLAMDQLIVYVLSSCCSFCTFAWLANILIGFLSLLHDYVVFDWALAIVVLVIVVRTLLHPLMKSSQIKMQRFGRAMSELKPELDALQKRYKGEPQKLQQEQLRLYREKHVNPAGCVGGILPTFLQTPIWIALYAVLYFAFELRQQGAFFGVFQLLDGWQFLGDLSRPDNFLLFPKPIDLQLFKIHGVNLLPLLMGIVFFIQQKYMSPPTPNMTPEQEQQQKIMKVMMVVLFPVMLYPAPSGLTLYILTSTCIGIIESRMVKKHIELYGLAAPPKPLGKDGKPKQDLLGRKYQEMIERAKMKQQQQQNRRTFKDRE